VVGFKEKGSGKEMIAGKEGRVCFSAGCVIPFLSIAKIWLRNCFMLWI
jgi:hypothetical protein